MQDNFDVTIIIPTCNRARLFESCIKSVTNQTILPTSILVIDQSDNDETLLACKNHPQVTYERLGVKNKSEAVNFAITKCKTKYISILDDDCLLPPDWVEVACKTFLTEKFQIIQGKIIAGEIESKAEKSRLDDSNIQKRIFKKKIITPIFKVGCNFIVEATLFNEVGVFDTDFGPGSKYKSSDDNEWGYRLLQKNIIVLYQPNLRLIHRSWRNRNEDLKQMSDYGYAVGAFLHKMKSISKLDFAYHYLNIKRWILYNKIKFAFKPAKRKPFSLYNKMLKKGFSDYDAY